MVIRDLGRILAILGFLLTGHLYPSEPTEFTKAKSSAIIGTCPAPLSFPAQLPPLVLSKMQGEKDGRKAF